MYVIIMAYIDILHADVIEVIATTLCTSFELLAGGASFFAVFKKSQAGISMMVIGYNVVTVNILVALPAMMTKENVIIKAEMPLHIRPQIEFETLKSL